MDATEAVEQLARGEIPPREAALAVRKDLLDAYQSRLLTYLDDADQAADRGFAAALAETGAIAAGYWPVISAEYRTQRGAEQAASLDSTFTALADAAAAGDAGVFRKARNQALAGLDGFTAAPYTTEEQARRTSQLIRFLDLVPVEYDRGTDDGRVTLDFEVQEAIAFAEGAGSAFGDLKSELVERDPAGVATVESSLARPEAISREAGEGGEVASQEEIEATHQRATETLDGMLPEEWKQSDAEADFELIAISLDQMEAALGAGRADEAERDRLSAYAFFEFGPELQLKATQPQLALDVEGLIWYGARDTEGLAELIASGASVREVREARIALDEALEESRSAVGESSSPATVITNAALIVFREGLEAILIIAAITASMVGANRRFRRPIYKGALLALPATALLWLLALTILDSLSQYGEKLEAVVGLVAIAVLLLVMNWFFHRVYWTEWIAGHRKRGKSLAAGAATAGVAAGATVLGLYTLGFTSVLREGFETVLFLQALQLSNGIGVVLAGVALGLIMTAAVGALTFALESRLPYKRMLVVTGALIALVLVVMVGNTVRTMQGVGWISITPIDVELPLWMGTWLGVFPTWESIGAQLAAFAIVIGSYYAAEWARKRKVGVSPSPAAPARAAAPARSPLEALPGPASPHPANGSNGRGRSAPAPDTAEQRKAPRQREPSKSR